jgi:hypothetical protein
MLRKRIGNDRASAEGTEPLHWLYSSIGKYLSYRRIKPISHCGGYGTCRKAARRRRRILKSRILSCRWIKPISHCGGYGTCRKGKCVKKNLRKICIYLFLNPPIV